MDRYTWLTLVGWLIVWWRWLVGLVGRLVGSGWLGGLVVLAGRHRLVGLGCWRWLIGLIGWLAGWLWLVGFVGWLTDWLSLVGLVGWLVVGAGRLAEVLTANMDNQCS